VRPVGYIWIFAQKQNKNDEIVRYKVRVVAQWFFTSVKCNNISIFDHPSCTIRYAFTSNRWCYNLFVRFSWEWYLYGILEEFNLPNKTDCKEDYSIKLDKSLYWLKQSGRMWYNCLSECFLKGYENDPICPYIYMKILEREFAIIVVYVDDINIVGTPNKLTRIIYRLKKV